jgi:hypothetical protein
MGDPVDISDHACPPDFVPGLYVVFEGCAEVANEADRKTEDHLMSSRGLRPIAPFVRREGSQFAG